MSHSNFQVVNIFSSNKDKEMAPPQENQRTILSYSPTSTNNNHLTNKNANYQRQPLADISSNFKGLWEASRSNT